MAEFAGAIVGLIQVTEHVTLKVFRYLRHVKQAEKEIRQLSATIASLLGTIHGIELAVRELDRHSKERVLQSTDLVACKNTITHLSSKLSAFVDKSQPGQPAQSLQVHKKWKWPFTMPETVEINLKLESHKSALSLSLAADNLVTLLQMSTSQEVMQKSLRKLEVSLEAQARVKMTKKREEALKRLYPQSPLHHHQTNRRLRQSGTGDWFIQSAEFQKWMAEDNGKLWVYGIPGAGKSVLAAYAIDQILADRNERCAAAECAIAYFYCDYKDAMTQKPMSILGSLAQQLARQDERSLASFEDFLKKFSLDRQTNTLSYECEDLCQLLSSMAVNFGEVIFVIDGLDECEGFVAEVSAYLARLTEDTVQFKALLFSRHIVEVSQQLQDYDKVSIAARSSDLLLFVGEQIGARINPKSLNPLRIKDPKLKDEILETLVSKAEGMFRWVALQLDYICGLPTDKAIREALVSLPQDLFSSYERLLVQLNKKPRSVRHLFEKAMKWILAGGLNAQAVCEAVSVEADMTHLDITAIPEKVEILRHCGSFIREDFSGKSFEFAHFTVKEFFSAIDAAKNPEFAPYRFDSEDVQKLYAQSALICLCMQDFEDKSTKAKQDRKYDLSFCDIVIERWFTWAQSCLSDPMVEDLTRKLFTHGEGRDLLRWASNFVTSNRFWLYADVPPKEDSTLQQVVNHLGPLHYAAMLNLPDVCQWLIEQGYPTASLSPVGSPLYCAMVGISSFSTWTRHKSNSYGPQQHISVLNTFATAYSFQSGRNLPKLQQTLKILTDAGANINERPPFMEGKDCPPNLLDIAIYTACPISTYYSDMSKWLDIVAYLVSIGAVCSEKESINTLLVGLEKRLSHDGTLEKYRDLLQQLSQFELDAHDRQNLEKLMEKWRQRNPLSFSAGKSLNTVADPSLPVTLSLSLWFDAARYNYVDTITRFISSQVADLDAVDDRGCSALHLAARWSSSEVAFALIENGANVNQVSLTGSTPILEALANSDLTLVQHLIKSGGDCTAMTHKKENVWHFAAQNPKVAILKELHMQPHEVRALATAEDSSGQTALSIAAKSANADAFFFLLEFTVNESAVDEQGRTLLHHAASGGNTQIVECLIGRGHSVITQDTTGYNALLHAASQQPQTESLVSCQQLLYKADPTCTQAETNDGSSIEDFLIEKIALAHDTRLDSVDWAFLQDLLMRDANSGLKKLVSQIRKTKQARYRRPQAPPPRANQQDFGVYNDYGNYPYGGISDPNYNPYVPDYGGVDDGYFSDEDEIEFDSQQPYPDDPLVDPKSQDQNKKTHGKWANLANIFETCHEDILGAHQLIMGQLVEVLLSQSDSRFMSYSVPHLTRLVCTIINGLDTDTLQTLRVEKRQLLNIALDYGWSDVVSSLMTKNLDVDAFDDESSAYPDNAVQISCSAIVKLPTFELIVKASKNLAITDRSGNSLLHLAATSTTAGKVDTLIKAGLKVDGQSLSGTTALHMASQSRSLSIVKLLLENGADASLKDSRGYTAAHCAASRGRVSVLRQLSNTQTSWTQTCNLMIQSPRYMSQKKVRGANLLHLAAICGSVKCLTYLLSFPDMFDVNGTPEQDLSPLQLAIWHNRQKAAEFLLESGANVTSLPWQGLSLLHVAAQRGNSQIVTVLLSHHHDILVTDAKGFTPLDLAVQSGFTDIAKIIDAYNIDKRSISMNSLNYALGFAIERGDLRECQKLILDGASLFESCSYYSDMDPMLHALYNGRREIAEHFLEAGARCDAITARHLATYGYTALHYCVLYYDNNALLDQVLDACPDLMFLETDIHPIHLAVILQDHKSLQTMLDQISECWSKKSRSHLLLKTDNEKYPDKQQPISQLSSVSRFQKIALLNDPSLLKDLRIEARLPQSMIETSSKSTDKTSAVAASFQDPIDVEMEIHARNRHQDLVEQIKSYGGLTALHCAAKISNTKAIESLLAAGADVNSLSSKSETPLVEAIFSGNDAGILALLDKGASMHGYDRNCTSNIENVVKKASKTVLERFKAHIHETRNIDIESSNTVTQCAMAASPDALIELGMDEESLTAPDNMGESAVQRCILDGSPSVFSYIVNSGYDLSGSTEVFGSVLHLIWTDEKCSILQLLLRRLGRQQSTLFLNTKPQYRQTPLYNAAAMEQLRVVDHLLTYQIDLDMVGGPSGSALMAAATYGRMDAVKVLVNAGASISYCSQEDGLVKSAFTQAKHFPHIQRWLLVGRFQQRRWLSHQ